MGPLRHGRDPYAWEYDNRIEFGPLRPEMACLGIEWAPSDLRRAIPVLN